MKKKSTASVAALRRKAREKLRQQTDRLRELSKQDAKRLITELGTHQIELEMQNEELRKAQMELEASRLRYADLYDFSPVGYFTFDRRGVIMEANLTGANQLGADKRELIKKLFPVFIANDAGRKTFVDHCAGVLDRAVRSAKPTSNERTALFHARPKIVERRGNRRSSGRQSDVTSLKWRIAGDSEERNVSRDKRRRHLNSTAGQDHLRFPAVNRSFKPARVIGTPFTIYIDPGDAAKATEAFQRAVSGERIDMLDLRFRGADGSLYHAEINITPVLRGGDIVAVQGISRDITERKRAEDSLRAAHAELENRTYELDAVNRELEAFAYTVSNDLKAPLRSIEGFTRAVLEDYADKWMRGQDYLMRVTAASQRMTSS
jgi:PAS domain S-box-containing protein